MAGLAGLAGLVLTGAIDHLRWITGDDVGVLHQLRWFDGESHGESVATRIWPRLAGNSTADIYALSVSQFYGVVRLSATVCTGKMNQ